jgi:hypothetical protein
VVLVDIDLEHFRQLDTSRSNQEFLAVPNFEVRTAVIVMFLLLLLYLLPLPLALSGSEDEEESAQDAGLCETQGGGGDGGNV